MNATKEECSRVYSVLNGNGRHVEGGIMFSAEQVKDVLQFLAAAGKSLPTEASVQKDKERRKNRPKLAHDTMAAIRGRSTSALKRKDEATSRPKD